MIRRSLFLFWAFCVLPLPAMAEEKAQYAPILEKSDKDSAKALNDFIARAVDDGLLDRPGTKSSSENGEAAGEDFPSLKQCAIVADADFVPLREFAGFSDLMEMEASEVPFPPIDRIKARMSLGLYAEARALVKDAGSDSSYLLNLAHLLEYHASPENDYFTEFARCSEPASFWSSVAKLADHDASGIEGLKSGIRYFRDLPVQMQTDIVTITVPALDGFGETLIAQKMMTSFSDDDIKNSSSLQFNAALLDVENEKKIDEFIIRPEFRFKALAAIVQRGDTLSTPQRELLLDEVADIIDNETDERQLTIALKFALKEFGKRSNVDEMIALAKLPKLQSPAARNTIHQHIAEVIERDLKSEDQLKVLSTIQMMLDQSNMLEDHASTTSLYEDASERAKALGYSALSRRLIDRNLRQLEEHLQQAELAYRKSDFARVYMIADKRPNIPGLSLLAARSALEESDKASLGKFEDRLLKHPSEALRLIQEDAADGKWLVSEKVYLAAGASSDPADAKKAANILALRREAIAAQKRPNIGLGSVETILAKSTKDLHPNTKEVN